MRFVRIYAKAFGPLADVALELAEGMNVIVGPNGAGKSSWHNAIYAALCGIRRGPGMRSADALFAQRHKPWNSEQWEVRAEILRDDGRRVEIHRELANNVDCGVCELPTGRDISADFINEGSPDGARLVGLDRQTFLSTASVRQTEMANIEYDGALQQQLQRAAATAGGAATAAAAIAAIDNYAREHVGLDRRNSTKPLRAAKDALEQARYELTNTEREHEVYLRRLSVVEQSRSQARQARLEVIAAEAIFALDQARELRAAFLRAEELAKRFEASPPPDVGADEETATNITVAVQTYQTLANQTTPPLGEETDALRSAIDDLPKMPDGEIAPARDIKDAQDTYVRFLGGDDDARDAVVASATSGSTHEQYRESVAAKARVRPRMSPWLSIAVVASLTSALLFLHKDFAIASLLAGIALLAAGLTYGIRVQKPGRSIEQQDARRLRHDSHGRLLELLRSRGYQGDDGIALYRQYTEDCDARNTIARSAERRSDLEKRLKAAVAMHDARKSYGSDLAEAERRLHEIASTCSCDDTDPAEASNRLKRWLATRAEQRQRVQHALEERGELETLLDGHTLDELRQKVRAQEHTAEATAKQINSATLEAWKTSHGVPAYATIQGYRAEASSAEANASRAEGELAQLMHSLPDVAARRDAVSEAERESRRVEGLASTLEQTKQFLQQAQTAVHNDIAPMLVATLERWLPQITDRLYVGATVDPERLDVKVRSEGGALREARLLSYGTCEQIYLLLRVAMTDHLTKASGETCPFLLDDITAHCDLERTQAILTMLHELSKTRQIVLFTQEFDVAEWAKRTLREPEDKLVSLDPSALAV